MASRKLQVIQTVIQHHWYEQACLVESLELWEMNLIGTVTDGFQRKIRSLLFKEITMLQDIFFLFEIVRVGTCWFWRRTMQLWVSWNMNCWNSKMPSSSSAAASRKTKNIHRACRLHVVKSFFIYSCAMQYQKLIFLLLIDPWQRTTKLFQRVFNHRCFNHCSCQSFFIGFNLLPSNFIVSHIKLLNIFSLATSCRTIPHFLSLTCPSVHRSLYMQLFNSSAQYLPLGAA